MGRNGSNDWKTAQFGDVIELFDSQRVPLNSRERQERKGQYPYYGAQGVIDHIDGYIFDGRYILVAEDGENLNSKKLPLALFAKGKFWVNNHAHILRGKPGVTDDTFLLACLNNADIKPFVTGAAQPKLSQANLRQIEIPLPPLPVQRRIAGILSAYDELIENSQRRIRILEAMARALYREWFVHFRFPGHDNSAGVPNWTAEGRPEGVSATDGANQMHPRVASPLGDIPQGWEVTTFGELYNTGSGGTPSRARPEYFEDGTIDWVKSQELLDDYVLSTEERITERALKESSAKLFPANAVLIALYGATIGKLAILSRAAATNQACCAILPKHSAFGREFAFLTLLLNRERIIGLRLGAAQQNISQVLLRNLECVKPPDKLAIQFSERTAPLFDGILTLQRQIQNLRRTRDLLLPRLLSGQVKLKAQAA
jgi:type I restriction enzyme S subunit